MKDSSTSRKGGLSCLNQCLSCTHRCELGRRRVGSNAVGGRLEGIFPRGIFPQRRKRGGRGPRRAAAQGGGRGPPVEIRLHFLQARLDAAECAPKLREPCLSLGCGRAIRLVLPPTTSSFLKSSGGQKVTEQSMQLRGANEDFAPVASLQPASPPDHSPQAACLIRAPRATAWTTQHLLSSKSSSSLALLDMSPAATAGRCNIWPLAAQ